MVIYREFKELKGVSSPVHWAMGMFDGLHLGHAGVIAAAVEGAARDGGIAAVLTFRTHPLARVRPESVPPAIMAVDAEKFALMEELGVKMVLTLEFSSRLASMSRRNSSGSSAPPAAWRRLPWGKTGTLAEAARAMWKPCAFCPAATGSG